WPNPLDPDGSKHKLATATLKQAEATGNAALVAEMRAKQKKLAPVTVFELRGGLVQDVLPPSIHPDTGMPYFWRTPPSADGLPELPRELLSIWTNWEIFKPLGQDRKSTRLNSSHVKISYAVFCLKKKKKK